MLHFELCYYRLIERAIERRHTLFEAGAQGEHKLKRGLAPAFTHSAHWIRDPGLGGAIAAFIEREAIEVAEEAPIYEQHAPFRATGAADTDDGSDGGDGDDVDAARGGLASRAATLKGQVLGDARGRSLVATRPRPRYLEDSQQTSSPGRSDLIEVFYFFYYQSVGIYMTFMPAYLRGLGLSGREISTVFALSPLLALAVPLAWAYLADRTHRHDRVLRVVIGGAWLGFTPMLFARQLRGDPDQLGAVRAVRGRRRRPGRRASRSRACAPAPCMDASACGVPSAYVASPRWRSALSCPCAAALRIGWCRSRCG